MPVAALLEPLPPSCHEGRPVMLDPPKSKYLIDVQIQFWSTMRPTTPPLNDVRSQHN
jgi:hypothetical protein